jgi:hypothetical protein
MKFPRHWALAQVGAGLAWGWSDTSQAEAQAEAQRRAAGLDARLRGSARPPSSDGYYPDRPMREEVLHELAHDDQGLSAAVTRNASGAEVLNAAQMLFVDVDLPPPAAPSLLARLLGAPSLAPGAPSPAEAAVVARAVTWTQTHPGWGWRIYRTAAGLRLLATHALFYPDDEVVQEVFRALGADPLYCRLCLSQDCFRARLTPKPWRIGLREAPPRWPWADAAAAAQFTAWSKAYRDASARYATCALVQTAGSTEVLPELRPLVEWHDAACKVGSGLPLA